MGPQVRPAAAAGMLRKLRPCNESFVLQDCRGQASEALLACLRSALQFRDTPGRCGSAPVEA